MNAYLLLVLVALGIPPCSPLNPHQSFPTSPLRAAGDTGFRDSFAEPSHSSEDEVVDLGTTERVTIR